MITCSSTDRKAWTYVEILTMGLLSKKLVFLLNVPWTYLPRTLNHVESTLTKSFNSLFATFNSSL